MKNKKIDMLYAAIVCWLMLVSFGGCKKACYLCAYQTGDFLCFKGADTISVEGYDSVQISQQLNHVYSNGYKCDTAFLFYTSQYVDVSCDKNTLQQAAQLGNHCIQQ